MNGIINIYKPTGMTSHDVVYKIRRLTGIKKVGHTGTLDPDAEGVLPVCIGKGTRLSDMLTATDKGYRAVMTLGAATDTQDASGKILYQSEVNVTEDELQNAAQHFVGELEQIPPMYSAIKQNGKKLYELARAGIEVERKPRPVTVYELKVISVEGNNLIIDVSCSKGTYIRTICHDMGEYLGCGAFMSSLVRTKSGMFDICNSVKLNDLTHENIKNYIIPVDKMFDYPVCNVTEGQERRVRNGNPVRVPDITEGEMYRVYSPDGTFLCVSKATDGELKMVKSFY